MILRVGATMLAAGTGARRVVETVRRVAEALDIDTVHSECSLTHLTLTVTRRGISRTQIAEIPSPGVNADLIAALQAYALHLPRHVTVREVNEGLDRILSRPKQWPAWAAPAGAGLACAAFAFLNNGRWLEIGAVFLAAAAGQSLRRSLHRRQLNQLAMAFLSAVLAAALYMVLLYLTVAVLPIDPVRSDAGLVSAILFLVPGFPLMTAALDLARLDLTCGITRLTYAALLTFAAGMGLWVVAWATGVNPQPAPPPDLPGWMLMGLQVLASFLAVFGFAVVFNSPPRLALAAGLIAMVANPIRLLLLDAGLAPQNAAVVGTFVVGLLAFAARRGLGLPRIVLSVPGVVIMIPGAAAFRALVDFTDGRLLASLDNAITALTVVTGMAIGLVAARMLTDPRWGFSTPNPPSYTSMVRRLAPYVGRRRTRSGHAGAHPGTPRAQA